MAEAGGGADVLIGQPDPGGGQARQGGIGVEFAEGGQGRALVERLRGVAGREAGVEAGVDAALSFLP